MTTLAINNSVILSLFKTLGLLDTDNIGKFHYDLEIKYNTDDSEFIYLIIYYYYDKEFIVFSKTKVSVEEFEKIENTDSFSIVINAEYIKKIILFLKWYPKNILFIELNFNVVSISTDACPYCKIMYSFDSLEIEEPVLLRHTCVIETDTLKKIFELCTINGQYINLEINNDILCISNFDKSIKCALSVSDNKKTKAFQVLRHEYICFLLNRIMTIRSKTCRLYIGKELPFVIEDVDIGHIIYVAPLE